MLKVLFMTLLSFSAVAQSTPITITLTERNSVSFNQPVRDSYVAKKQAEILKKASELRFYESLYLVLDTPGGSVVDGLLFIDTLKSLNRPIHTITIFAASMGYQIVQELGTRYILPSGTLMSHRGAVGGLSGQVPGELNSRLVHIQNLLQRMNEAAAKRINIGVKEYQDAIVNELWSSGQGSVNSKQADQVVYVKCDKALASKTYTESVSTFLGNIDVEYSACPLISSPIGISSDRLSRIQLQKVEQQVRMQKRHIHLTY